MGARGRGLNRGRVYYRQGGVAVRYSDTMARLAREAVERAAPGVLDKVEGELGAVLQDARAEWPVKTGRSRAGLQRVTNIDPVLGTVSVQLRNDVPYAIYIKPTKLHGATTAWQRWVRGPAFKVIRELPVKLAELMSDTLGGA